MRVAFRDNISVWFVVAGVLEMEHEQDRDAIRKAKILYSSCINESKDLLTQSEFQDPILLSGESKKTCGLLTPIVCVSGAFVHGMFFI